MGHGVGWRVFAGTVLGIAGISRIFDGIWAFRYHGAVPEDFQGAIFGHSLKTYGWVYLIVGIVLVALSLALVFSRGITGQVARWTGVVGGGLLAISAVWWLPFYPVWSLVYIGIGILVVYALVAHATREEMELAQQTY